LGWELLPNPNKMEDLVVIKPESISHQNPPCIEGSDA